MDDIEILQTGESGTMPDNWTALKCEECENPLEPLAYEGPRLIYMESAKMARELVEALNESSANYNKKPFSAAIPVLGGEMQIEVVKSPLADLLRCTSCGLLYERRVTSIA